MREEVAPCGATEKIDSASAESMDFKETAAAPCFMDCHALRCKARNDGEKLKIKQVAGGRIFELKTAFFKAHKEIRLEVY